MARKTKYFAIAISKTASTGQPISFARRSIADGLRPTGGHRICSGNAANIIRAATGFKCSVVSNSALGDIMVHPSQLAYDPILADYKGSTRSHPNPIAHPRSPPWKFPNIWGTIETTKEAAIEASAHLINRYT